MALQVFNKIQSLIDLIDNLEEFKRCEIEDEVKNCDQIAHEQKNSLGEQLLQLQTPKYQRLSEDEVSNMRQNQGHWSNALKVLISPNRDAKWNRQVFYETDKLIVIYDLFPKAIVHLLILPKRENINDIWQLLDTNSINIQDSISLMQEIVQLAQWLIGGLTKQMNNVAIQFIYGFHAIPSMNQLHCHVISTDFNSFRMKKKKHWNSFTTKRFIPAIYLLKYLLQLKENINADNTNVFGQKEIPKVDKNYYESLIKTPLQCHKCLRQFSKKGQGMNALKKHVRQCNINTSKIFNQTTGVNYTLDDVDDNIINNLLRTV